METNHPLKIFIAYSDPGVLQLYEQHLRSVGYQHIFLFRDADACVLNISRQQPEVLFLDHNMKLFNGINLLKKIRAIKPDVYVVFIAGRHDVQTVFHSLQSGAFDYIIRGSNEVTTINAVLEKIQAARAVLQKQKQRILNLLFSSN